MKKVERICVDAIIIWLKKNLKNFRLYTAIGDL